MRARSHSVAVVLGLGALGLSLVSAACSSETTATLDPPSAVPAVKGSLHFMSQGPVAVWDPQRLDLGADMAFAGRVFQRTLTAWSPATRQDIWPALAPDLATGTGKATHGGTQWTFTLRGDARWQDNKPVTCADVKYGISRSYATTEISGGLSYALDLLDVPHNADGSSTYAGPFSKRGQAGFNKAVSCSGRTIKLKLARAVHDFNQMVALSAFAPVRADKDRGGGSANAIFSNGPYQLKEPWQAGKGAIFVRNPSWDSASDPIRKARPSEIVYRDGIPVATELGRIMTNAGADSHAVTADSAPQVVQNQILNNPSIKARSSNPRGPFVDYLLPNFSRPTMAKLRVRQALAMATNRTAYVNALGGSSAEPTYAMINKSLPAYRDVNPLKVPPNGDAASARSLLKASGLPLPVKIVVAYRRGPPADNAMAALRKGWEAAGFSVTLRSIEKDYFTNIASVPRSRNYDVMWAVGCASWPSGSSVIPPLFDSRRNLSATSSGQNYGRFSSAAFNAKIDAAGMISRGSVRERAWADLDEQLAVQVAAIALTNSRSVFVHGSEVQDYSENPALFGTVDLATASVS
jgi:peptide/nickel transport system substrate-binding protein